MSLHETKLSILKIIGISYMELRGLVDTHGPNPKWIILSFVYLDAASLRERIDILFRELDKHDKKRDEHYDLDS